MAAPAAPRASHARPPLRWQHGAETHHFLLRQFHRPARRLIFHPSPSLPFVLPLPNLTAALFPPSSRPPLPCHAWGMIPHKTAPTMANIYQAVSSPLYYAPALLCSRAAMLPRCYAPSLLCSRAAMLPRCHAPSLLCSLAAMLPRCYALSLLFLFSGFVHTPRVLEECAAAWGSYEWGYGANVFPPPEWRVGGDCDTADLIRCDANGLIIEMWIDNSPIPDSRYGSSPAVFLPPCLCPPYSVPANCPIPHPLSLRHNDLEGSIPASFSMLTSLVYLDLSNNQLSGAIAPSISTLTSLKIMALENNRLGGTIPDAMSTLTNLGHLSVARLIPRPPNLTAGASFPQAHATTVHHSPSCAHLSHSHAPISSCSSHHTPTPLCSPHLLSSRLSHNSLSGSLDDLSQLTNLHGLCVKPPPALHPPLPIYSPTHLFPSRSFTSLNLPSFPSARHPPSLAPSLFLHPSLFPTHSFPPILPPLPLNALHPFAPHITQGAFQQRHIRPDPRRPGGPRQLNKPVSFMIHAVRMGESAMCRWVHCPPLQRNASGALQLGSGRYALWLIRDSGPLRLLRQKLLSPACRPQGDLSNNNLSGAIPPSIDNLVSLITLILSNNNLTGTIPSSISNLFWLSSLRLDGNALESPIPESLSAMEYLRILDVSKNKLSEDISTFSCVQLEHMKLSNNNITGSIRSSITSFDFLTYLDLSYTLLTGNIPTVITKMQNLLRLDLRIPTLTGSIPASMGAMLNLQYLYVNHNATPCGYGECEVVQYSGTAFCRACTDFCDSCDRK
ncbi:unnamed protein product, partial [Closterium sp. NIES-64]